MTDPHPSKYLRMAECNYGRFLVSSRDQYIGRSALLYGEYATEEVELMKQLLPEGQGPYFVLDIGANIGFHSVPLANHLRTAGGSLHAYEPQRIAHQMLCANLMLNECFNVQTLNQGLGSENTVMHIRDAPMEVDREINYGNLNLTKDKPDDGVMPVLTRRLDDVGYERLHLMKIDVEGMELEVLKGGVDIIQREKPAMYVENDRGPLAKGLIEYIDSIGYKMYWHAVMLYTKDNYNRSSNNIFESLASINMLCLHESRQDQFQKLNTKVFAFEPVDLKNPIPKWYPPQKK